MIRGVVVAVPEAAQSKLQALTVDRDMALDATRSCVARLSGLGRDFDPRLVARLAVERDKHNAKHAALSTLIHRLNQFLVELRLPANAVLEPVQAVSIKLAQGETVNEAISKVRTEIAALNRQLVAVKAAPLPQPDQIKAAEAFVAKMANAARPTVSVLRDDTVRVAWRDTVVGGVEDVMALLCWVMPEAVLSALTRDIEQMPTPINPLTRSERLQKVSELEGQLLELGFLEEGLLSRAAQDGIDVMRRGDADPKCVLGIAVTKKAPTAQMGGAGLVA